MFENLFPVSRCAHCSRPRYSPDIDAMIATGKLKIADNVPAGVAEKIVADYFAGKWGKPKQGKPFDFVEAGKYLMAAFEIGDTVFHVLTDHTHSFTEIVVGE